MTPPVARGTAADVPRDDTVEDDLARVAAGLPDDPRSEELLEELRDHLLCQREASASLPPGPAAGPAGSVGLGDPADLAAGWSDEVRTTALRRVALAVLRLSTVAVLAWVVVLLLTARGPWRDGRPAAVLHDEQIVSFCAVATLGAAVGGVLLVGLGARLLPGPRARLLGVGVVTTSLLSLAGGLVAAGAVADVLGRAEHSGPVRDVLPDVLVAAAATVAAAVALSGPVARAARLLRSRRAR